MTNDKYLCLWLDSSSSGIPRKTSDTSPRGQNDTEYIRMARKGGGHKGKRPLMFVIHLFKSLTFMVVLCICSCVVLISPTQHANKNQTAWKETKERVENIFIITISTRT